MKRATLAGIGLATLSLIAATTTAQAAILQFGLDGNAGAGLLSGNENPAVIGGGTGGLGPAGITLDTSTNMISIDVLWGSANGFADLTGDATLMHIHLPTADPAPTGFGQNAGASVTLNTLAGFNASAASGGFNGTVALSDAQETAIINEQSYINVHTAAHGGGEIRGHLVIVPEPASLALLTAGAALLLRRHRR